MTEEQSEVTLEEYLHTALKIARQAGNVKNCVMRSSYNYLASRTWIYDVWGGCVGVWAWVVKQVISVQYAAASIIIARNIK